MFDSFFDSFNTVLDFSRFTDAIRSFYLNLPEGIYNTLGILFVISAVGIVFGWLRSL